MKRLLPIFLLLLILLTALPALADFYIKSPDSAPVNMRKSRSTHSEILMRLITGTRVEIIKTDDTWSYIYVDGTDGYVLNTFLTSEDPYAQVTEPEYTEDEEEDILYLYVESPNSAPVNLRSDADIHSRIISRVITGTVVQVIEEKGEWTQIYIPGTEGYIRTEYLTNQMPIIYEDPGYAIVYIMSENSAPVNMRSAPGGKVIDKLLTGTEVKIVQMGDDWTEITARGQNGYVMTKYLTAITPKLVSGSYTAHVDGTSVRVRYGAGSGYDIVTTLPDGTEVIVLGTVKGWARIRCDNVEGFIDLQYLTE